jgi:hypothetical protein
MDVTVVGVPRAVIFLRASGPGDLHVVIGEGRTGSQVAEGYVRVPRAAALAEGHVIHSDGFGAVDIGGGAKVDLSCRTDASGCAVPIAVGDGFERVVVDLVAIAHRFKKGTRICVQIASGAHPRVMRNVGTGEIDAADLAQMMPTWQEIARDEDRPTAMYLPVFKGMLPT